jgi:hypothetical protein
MTATRTAATSATDSLGQFARNELSRKVEVSGALVARYQDRYRLYCVRGPEDIIVALAQELG